MKANIKLLFIGLLCTTFATQHMAQTDSTDTSRVTEYPDYGISIGKKVDGDAPRWEHEPVSFFDDKENGERYLEGRAAFMGSGKELGLRITIGIKGNAYNHYGELGPYTPVVLQLENRRTVVLRVYHYESIYDPKGHRTFYKVAFNIDNEDRRLLQKNKISAVTVGWVIGKEVYQVFKRDALIEQLDDIKRARTDGIITRR